MLGLIGFFTAAASIIFFVQSFKKTFTNLDKKTMLAFTTAFSMLASVMILCGVISARQDPETTRTLILAVDVVMLVATGLLLTIFVKLESHTLTALSVVAGLLVGARAFLEPIVAKTADGILYFNLSGAPRAVLLALILGIWLPAAAIAASRAARTVAVSGLANLMTAAYIMLTVITAVLFSSQQRPIIIGTFGLLVAIFFVLGLANITLGKMQKKLKEVEGRGSHAD